MLIIMYLKLNTNLIYARVYMCVCDNLFIYLSESNSDNIRLVLIFEENRNFLNIYLLFVL